MKKCIPKLFILLIVGYWLFLIHPAWLGKLGGTFKPKKVPQDYIVLKDFLISQKKFFRTLWLPMKQRFGFYSNLHPVVSGQEFMADDKCLAPFCGLKVEEYNREYFKCHPNEHCFPADFSFLANPEAPEVLSRLSIKYIIIPYDSQKKIFLKDRKYDEEAWKELIEFVESLGVYRRVDLPGQVRAYQLPEPAKEHFWIPNGEPEIKYHAINPTKYRVQVQDARQPFNLVFSETYDKLWQARLPAGQAKIGERLIPSKLVYNNLNSFAVDQTGDFEMIVELAAQKYVYYGGVVSLATLLLSFGGLIYLKRRKQPN